MDISEHDARVERVATNDERLNRAETANDRLETCAGELTHHWQSLRELIEYYQSQWLEDREYLEGTPDDMYGVLSEDSVWNEVGRFYHAMQDVAETATRIVTEYEQLGSEGADDGGAGDDLASPATLENRA